jgi:hypothetical protein
MQDQDKIPVLCVPHQKKSFDKYRWCTYSQWQIALIPVVSSSRMTYVIMVSISTEEYNRNITYITTYPPSGARAFNGAWIELHTSWECIHVLRKRPQDISRSPCPRCAVMASRTTDPQPLPHDRDLPSYLFVCASLQKSKLQKVNVESKSQLACHMLTLL